MIKSADMLNGDKNIKKLMPVQVSVVTALLQKILQKQLIGVYLYGSAVLGGLKHESDLDILAIIKGCLNEEHRLILTKQLLELSGKTGDKNNRPLEVTIISENILSLTEKIPECEYMYGEWLRADIESGKIPQRYNEPDVILLLFQARSSSIVLYGVPAENLLPEIGFEKINKAILHSLPALMQSITGDERNVLLTLARMWYSLSSQKICPKDIAAYWAAENVPEELSNLLIMAAEGYNGKIKDYWKDKTEQLNKLITFLQRKIKGFA